MKLSFINQSVIVQMDKNAGYAGNTLINSQVYNVHLSSSEMQPGTEQLIWNAKNEKGNAVSAGIYFLKMQAGDYTETKKIIFER